MIINKWEKIEGRDMMESVQLRCFWLVHLRIYYNNIVLFANWFNKIDFFYS